jgi:hypothetical protein
VVTVTQPHPAPERPEKRKPVVAVDYEKPDTTPLRATVTTDADKNKFTFHLTPIGQKPRR